MSFLWLLVLLSLSQAADMEHTQKLIACMQVTRYQLMTQEETLQTLAANSEWGKEAVLTKIMAEMITKCIATIPLEGSRQIILEKEDSSVPGKFVEYAPLPDTPYLTEDAVKLTVEEEEVLAEIMEKTKQAEEARESSGGSSSGRQDSPSSQPIGTSLGLIYILVVFLVFAGIVIYGIKRINDMESSKKKKKKT